jgi:hypothetical protein
MEKTKLFKIATSIYFSFALLLFQANLLYSTEKDSVRVIIPSIPVGRLVDTNTMQQIYNEIKTPYKYGVILDYVLFWGFLETRSI